MFRNPFYSFILSVKAIVGHCQELFRLDNRWVWLIVFCKAADEYISLKTLLTASEDISEVKLFPDLRHRYSESFLCYHLP